jgi:hypothetical protein
MSWNEPVTERQDALIRKLYLEIDPDLGTERARVWLAEPRSRRDASLHIDTLIEASKRARTARAEEKRLADLAARAAAPVTPEPVAATASVPVTAPVRPALVFPEDGYYAVFYEHTLRFYRVKHGKGYYKGRSFLDRFKSDELRAISYAERAVVLDLINANPDEAGMRFAVELTRCRCCGRMLTDEISRLRGEGPDCWGRKAGRDEIGRAALSDL